MVKYSILLISFVKFVQSHEIFVKKPNKFFICKNNKNFVKLVFFGREIKMKLPPYDFNGNDS